MARFMPFLLLLSFFSVADAANSTNNPNVWNFQIARKVIAAFQYKGMGMSIWEDQGVENTTIVFKRQFYVTPITEFLPNSSQCEYNELTGAYFVSYNIQLWNDRLQMAAVDRLKAMQIDVSPEQVQPLPFYQVRVIWNNAQEKLQKASLSTTWLNNLQQESIRSFKVLTEDKETCDRMANSFRTNPELFTSSIALQYSLSATSTATRILAVKTDHFLNSQLMASLKSMDQQNPERYLTADDANRLTLEITDNVVASQVVDGEYVPDSDMITLKDIINNALQLQNVDVGNFTSKMWESVYWDPVYARPDKVTSYLNKILKIDQGKHAISKTDKFSNKDEGGIDFGIGGLKFGGKSGGESSTTTSFDEMNEWLHQHNYDVEIQGELFLPKSRNLKRVNLGVLTRQETIYTKSVQMNHVDAPGMLTVTVGAISSSTENEDIKTLRQGMAALTTRLDQLEPREGQVEARLGQLEAREGQVEARLGQLVTTVQTQQAQLTANIESVRSSLSNAIGTKISQCRLCIKPTANPGASMMCTGWSKNPSWYDANYCSVAGCSYIIYCEP